MHFDPWKIALVRRAENRLNFFLEADRSTSTHKRFQQKLIAYRQYLEDGRHTEKYGIKNFRVVTFTLTEKRALGLKAAARDVLPENAFKYFLFASVQGLSIADPKPLLSDMFIMPGEVGESDRRRLVPMASE